MKKEYKILERLKAKASSSFNDKVRMPSVRQISFLLNAYNISHDISTKTNVVEYRSKRRRYVNSRHMGKSGLVLKIHDSSIELDTSSSYYSSNTWKYAMEILNLLQK